MPETYAVHDAAGTLLSIGTVVADPLPDGLTAKALTDAEAVDLAEGATWDSATLSVIPLVRPPYPPLDATGALATLLVVESVLDLTDAANAIHADSAHLVHEAESWSVG